MSKPPNATPGFSKAPQQVRIIAGRWKGKKLPVIQKQEVRPTPNRVRETLFNWLQGRIQGSQCLDLFAGSGALGFESISRGAAYAVIVDQDPVVIDSLQKLAELLDTDAINLRCEDGMDYIGTTAQKFDIVFLDPPFHKFDSGRLLAQLLHADVLKPHALIYVESPADKLPQALPADWQWWRQAKAGQVAYGLIATA